MPARHEDAEPRPARVPLPKIENIALKSAPRALAQQAFESGFLPQPAAGVETEALVARGYNPRRRRPFARRLRNTFWPPRVRLRTRNPWVRARRVFDGW